MPPDVDRPRDTDPPTAPVAADGRDGDDAPATVTDGVERIADKIKALLGANR